MKKHSKKVEQSESTKQSTRRDSREVMTELVARLSKQPDVRGNQVPVAEPGMPDAESPILDRLTVGVDLGDQWSNYCILGSQFRDAPLGSL